MLKSSSRREDIYDKGRGWVGEFRGMEHAWQHNGRELLFCTVSWEISDPPGPLLPSIHVREEQSEWAGHPLFHTCSPSPPSANLLPTPPFSQHPLPSLSTHYSFPYFLRNEHPSVKRAFPPVGWHSTVLHPPQMTTVWACEKTVVMVKQPGHLTSMKKERGAGTSCYMCERGEV